MQNILRTFTRQIVAGIRQDRLVVVGTVDARGNKSLRMRDFYQHAQQALAQHLAALGLALEHGLMAVATPAATAMATSPSGSQASAAPRCWQPKRAAERPSARRS
ncbi:MAG TPA: hypothetical protein VHC22_27285 [Pirellulales bacterium]|nr:hypothetical protein [Pirellulales bacterium]